MKNIGGLRCPETGVAGLTRKRAGGSVEPPLPLWAANAGAQILKVVPGGVAPGREPRLGEGRMVERRRETMAMGGGGLRVTGEWGNLRGGPTEARTVFGFPSGLELPVSALGKHFLPKEHAGGSRGCSRTGLQGLVWASGLESMRTRRRILGLNGRRPESAARKEAA